MQKKNENGLTPKQEAFCRAYVDAYGTDDWGNATAAIMKSYGYKSKTTACSEASRLMNDHKITTRLNDLLMERLVTAETDIKRLIERDVMAANFDDGLLWEEKEHNGVMLDSKIPISKLPKWIRILGEWKSIGGRAVFVVDKEAARERLHKALVKTQVVHEHTGTVNVGREITIGGLDELEV